MLLMAIGTLELALHLKHVILDCLQVLQADLCRQLSVILSSLMGLNCVSLANLLLQMVLLRALLATRLMPSQIKLRDSGHLEALAALVLLCIELLSGTLIVLANAQVG